MLSPGRSYTFSDLQHLLTDTGSTVHNYEALDANIKSRFLDTYYFAVKTLMKGTPEHQIAHDMEETSSPKSNN